MINIDIDKLVSDRKAFNEFVYTPIDEALKLLKERENDVDIIKYLNNNLPAGIPDAIKDKKVAVLFRQLATPNYESRRFINLIDSIENLHPVFWEYHSDKFTSNNEEKRALGKMLFHFGIGKKGGAKITNLNIIDFNQYNGKKISEVKTLWNQSLVDFHHEIFNNFYPQANHATFLDASDWFSKSGGAAKDYYINFIRLFLKDGILFENFMLDEIGVNFTKEIFLPAFIEIIKVTKHKPLIVALEPTEIEGDKFWLCHHPEVCTYLKTKTNLV